MIEQVEVIAIFNKDKNTNYKHSSMPYSPGKVRPVRFKYKELGISIDAIQNTYEETIEGEKILGYRCYNKRRGYYYHLLFYIQQLKRFIRFENN